MSGGLVVLSFTGVAAMRVVQKVCSKKVSNAVEGKEAFRYGGYYQLLSTLSGMTVEEKRAAVRAVVRRVVWDGETAHLLLFGDAEGSIEFPELPQILGETDTAEEMSDFLENEGEKAPSERRWCEDSK